VTTRKRGGKTQESDGVECVAEGAKPDTEVQVDEGTHWDVLPKRYRAFRINHSEVLSEDGNCTDQAGSYFIRLRRMIQDQDHHVSPRYLRTYAAHAAWVKDHHRWDNGRIARRMVGLAMAHPVSRRW